MNKFITYTLILIGSIGIANEQEDASSMGDLLKQIEQGQARDSVEAQKREARFQADRNSQQKILNDSRAERTREENRSEDLESTFETQFSKLIASESQQKTLSTNIKKLALKQATQTIADEIEKLLNK